MSIAFGISALSFLLTLIVIHGISLPPGNFLGTTVEDCFTNTLDLSTHDYYEKKLRGNPVSCHVYLKRDGTLIQFVPFNKRAWHAGVSVYKGNHNCNNFSVGIELQGGSQRKYTAIQYKKLAEVITALRQSYQTLSDAEIVGHNEISKGKRAPWATFNWDKLNKLL